MGYIYVICIFLNILSINVKSSHLDGIDYANQNFE